MINTLLKAVLVLGGIGAIFGIVLYWVSKKFFVEDNPMVDEIEKLLPGANCGGCGFAGCRALAEAIAKQGDLDGLRCTVGGDAVAGKIAAILGCEAEKVEPRVAVLHCNGTCSNAVKKTHFEGIKDCAFANTVFSGESGCAFGCLGLGNCTKECKFGAITMNVETGIPEVDESRWVGCGACARACPRNIIEMRPVGDRFRRVYVACSNLEKGTARKNCMVACIGCGKCERNCPVGAIHVSQNLAYIDYTKCICCGKCADGCPTGAIHKVNFPEPERRTDENI